MDMSSLCSFRVGIQCGGSRCQSVPDFDADRQANVLISVDCLGSRMGEEPRPSDPTAAAVPSGAKSSGRMFAPIAAATRAAASFTVSPPRCCSARMLGAGRRSKALICFDSEGSNFDAEQQSA